MVPSLDRRSFARALAATWAVGARAWAADDPLLDPVRRATPAPEPSLAISHVGFRPGVPHAGVLRRTDGTPLGGVALYDLGHHNTQRPAEPLRRLRLEPRACELGASHAFDLGELPGGRYQLHVGTLPEGEWSPPFRVGDDVWRALLPKALAYFRAQRCGVGVAGVHPPCHLDDARLPGGGRLDAIGGWHDAGDVRKTAVTMLDALALATVLRDLPNRTPADPTTDELVDELLHGNRGLLGQQGEDGRVWDQIGRDNRWTDGRIGSADDREVDDARTPFASAIFATAQALVAQAVRRDRARAAYARRCLVAAERAAAAFPTPDPRTTALAWQTWAAAELHRATGHARHLDRAATLARVLLDRQAGAPSPLAGRWLDPDGGAPIVGAPPEVEAASTAVPALALLALDEAAAAHADAPRWREAVARYLEAVTALTARNAYALLPLSAYPRPPTTERYRRAPNGIVYRYFYPSRLRKWWQGTNCHQAAHATLLARAAVQLPSAPRAAWVAMATRQLEWIVGCNPFGASMMTGVGARQVYPYSAFVGPILGGVVNGVAGNDDDEPVLDTRLTLDWRTTEYWSPHVSYLVTAITALERT